MIQKKVKERKKRKKYVCGEVTSKREKLIEEER